MFKGSIDSMHGGGIDGGGGQRRWAADRGEILIGHIVRLSALRAASQNFFSNVLGFKSHQCQIASGL